MSYQGAVRRVSKCPWRMDVGGSGVWGVSGQTDAASAKCPVLYSGAVAHWHCTGHCSPAVGDTWSLVPRVQPPIISNITAADCCTQWPQWTKNIDGIWWAYYIHNCQASGHNVGLRFPPIKLLLNLTSRQLLKWWLRECYPNYLSCWHQCNGEG